MLIQGNNVAVLSAVLKSMLPGQFSFLASGFTGTGWPSLCLTIAASRNNRLDCRGCLSKLHCLDASLFSLTHLNTGKLSAARMYESGGRKLRTRHNLAAI